MSQVEMGPNLKECIARSGTTSPQFARMLGVTPGCVRLWLARKRPAIRASLLGSGDIGCARAHAGSLLRVWDYLDNPTLL
jgi:hypothetical protein